MTPRCHIYNNMARHKMVKIGRSEYYNENVDKFLAVGI